MKVQSPICAELAELDQVSQDAYNPGGWLIFKAVLKNGVAKVVASDPHDTTTEGPSFWGYVISVLAIVERKMSRRQR